MERARTAAGIIIGGAVLIAMIWASADPRCPMADPDKCYATGRQGLAEIVKDRP